MILIIREIVLQHQQQKNTHSNAQGKPKNIQHGKKFIFEKDADRKFEIGKKHRAGV
jgi:hypothetical protein